MNDISIFLNTHSSCADCWPMFFGQLEKHWPGHPPIVVAADRKYRIDGVDTWIEYSSAPFGQQYLQGLSYVMTDYTLTLQEDFLLYGPVGIGAAFQALRDDPQYDFVRLIDSGRELHYSMQASIWKTDSLLKLYVKLRHEKTPWETEQVGSIAGATLNGIITRGRVKRGRNHFDSEIFPYISTALRRGKWNLSEYPEELGALLKEYQIDPAIRGSV